tara:strand:- start:138 stop:449 length:312 start_codon:yes stop_codon:yes gene_type:complete
MVRVLNPSKITMSYNVCVKEYAKNALYPYPVREKILSSKFHSNTTNFVYTNKPGYGGDSTINIKRTKTSQDILKKEVLENVKKINELLDDEDKENAWLNFLRS